jgi:hypothetical protein
VVGRRTRSRQFTPSATALQLLRNLGSVQDNLKSLGKDTMVQEVDTYLTYLQEKCTHELEFIDYATAALGWVYRILSDWERLQVFRHYRPAARPSAQHAYAPKAEVQYFCKTIEPGILALQGRDHRHEVK